MNEATKRRAAKPPTDYQRAAAQAFVSCLNTGRDGAKTAAQIAAEMRTGTRRVQQFAATARRIGYPVIANSERSPRGYYLAASPEDVSEYSGRLHHRAGEIHRTRRELLQNLKHWNFDTQQFDEVTADE